MSSKKKEPAFEEALEKLESLVASMESGDIPLADLVEKFEEGSKLVKTCEERLKHAGAYFSGCPVGKPAVGQNV